MCLRSGGGGWRRRNDFLRHQTFKKIEGITVRMQFITHTRCVDVRGLQITGGGQSDDSNSTRRQITTATAAASAGTGCS